MPGSTSGVAVGVSTVPEVPQLATASPGDTRPTPTAPHALSAPPPTTGVPRARPVALAAAALSLPSTSALPPTSGKTLMYDTKNLRWSEPIMAALGLDMIGSLQRRFLVSYMSVAEASDGSVAKV